MDHSTPRTGKLTTDHVTPGYGSPTAPDSPADRDDTQGNVGNSISNDQFTYPEEFRDKAADIDYDDEADLSDVDLMDELGDEAA